MSCHLEGGAASIEFSDATGIRNGGQNCCETPATAIKQDRTFHFKILIHIHNHTRLHLPLYDVAFENTKLSSCSFESHMMIYCRRMVWLHVFKPVMKVPAADAYLTSQTHQENET
ncbi:hypothetical protein D5086_015255 [Populus alba]|uniref:Uncharacterized protein n=3 Tax=Populus TaxID=3689 RepID=A0ACC4C0A7_POPAL|nr:hypothetical protein NC653_019277 [Populus alba x Populus x berolinensis]TKR74226.1 hypothetical protein D5086_0000298290 [Populus alba]